MKQPSPKSLFIPFQPVEFCFPDVFQPSMGVNEVLPCEAGLDDTHCYLIHLAAIWRLGLNWLFDLNQYCLGPLVHCVFQILLSGAWMAYLKLPVSKRRSTLTIFQKALAV